MDDLGLFEEERTERRRGGARERPVKRKRKTGRWIILLVVLVLIGGGAYYGYRQLSGIGGFDDFTGAGETDVVVEVKNGDSTGAIATRLKDQGVVASTKAFVQAAENEPKVRAVQPGYYVLRTKVSGKDAAAKIVDPKSRVGMLQIKAGTQLDDVARGDGSVTPGIVSLLAKASCADLNGTKTCVPVEELRKVADTADLAALGVPDWAIPGANGAPEPKRRLEGLVMPSVYDVKPGSTATELWTALLTSSSAQMQAIGMPKLAEETGFSPYQVLVMASLVEREAIAADFASVARVTYNRLKITMALQYDSTINYVQDRPNIRTNKSDRETPGPYNSYLNTGLPPTPISSPSKEALAATAKPADGTWLYFVRCQKDGKSCFANTLPEHQTNVAQAQANGAW